LTAAWALSPYTVQCQDLLACPVRSTCTNFSTVYSSKAYEGRGLPKAFAGERASFSGFQSVISVPLQPLVMAGRTVHHMDLEALLGVNREVVALTGELHGYSPADGEKLKELIAEVESRADNQDFQEAVPEKASLLVFKIASGQYFHAGNKRTALVAGQAFLRKNGYKLDLSNPDFVSAVDKVGIAAASLDDLYGVMRGLIVRSPAERKGWDKAVKAVVESNAGFLKDLGS
jgi:prophage maintenance system killer protein